MRGSRWIVAALAVLLGGAWLAAAGAHVTRRDGAPALMFVCALLGLWYLPLGTLLCLVQIVLLLPALRRRPASRG